MANDLIDRQEALKTFPPRHSKKCNMDYAIGFNKCRDTIFEQIKSLPQAEPEHARWIEDGEDMATDGVHLICSECNGQGNLTQRYCPNCGRKMDNAVTHNELQSTMISAAKAAASVAEKMSNTFSSASEVLNHIDFEKLFNEYTKNHSDNND